MDRAAQRERARGRWRGSPEQELPRRHFTGAGETGTTELGLDRGLVQKRERGTCSPLGLRAGLDRGSGGVRDGAGGEPHRSAVP